MDRYRFPTQDTGLREGDQLRSADGEPLGSVDAIGPGGESCRHQEKERRAVDEAARRRPGLYLAGNALHGTAFGKARRAERRVRK